MSRPVISVIIANFNGERYLEACLKSVFVEINKSYEVVVVDDASTDHSLNILKKFQKKRNFSLIQLKKNVGTGNAINSAVKKARGKYLFFLNNDAYIEGKWSNQIINFFKKFKKAGIGQSKILKVGTRNFDYAGDYIGPFGFLIERARGSKDQGQFDNVDQVFAIKGTAMFLRKEIFERLGGFDPDYKFALEETDLCWRAWLAGYEVYFVPTITVYHAFGTAEKVTVDYYHKKGDILYQGSKNTISTLIKNLGPKKLLVVLPIHIACWLILSILFWMKLQPSRGLALQKGITWNLLHLGKTLKKRSTIQKKRKLTDDTLFKKVGQKRELSYYLGKGLSYLTGRHFDI